MRMKLVVALVDDSKTETVIEAGRSGGATGATIITSARGEGLLPQRTFFGLRVEAQRDLVMFLVVIYGRDTYWSRSGTGRASIPKKARALHSRLMWKTP